MKNIYIIILLSLLSISCTQSVVSTDGSSSSESRIATPETVGEVSPSGYQLAFCSTIKNTANNFSAQLEPHKKNGLYISDQMYLRVKTVSGGLLSGADYIQFFKEYESDSGVATTDPSPAEFIFTNPQGYELATTTPITQLSSASMQLAIEESGLDEYYKNTYNIDYTPARLIVDFDILLRGIDLKYESIRTAFYSGGSPSATAQVAALIPAYAADPNTYASLDNSSYLAQLHPMYSRKNSGLTDIQFKQEIENVCRGN